MGLGQAHKEQLLQIASDVLQASLYLLLSPAAGKADMMNDK